MEKKQKPAILYFCAGRWKDPLPVGELRYPIYLVSKRWPVLFVEPPRNLLDRIRFKSTPSVPRCTGALRRINNTSITVFTPRFPVPFSVRLPLPESMKNFLLEWHSRSIAKQAMAAFKQVFPENPLPDIVWGTIFHHARLLKYVKGKHSLAIIDDNFPLSPVFTRRQQKQAAEMERELITRAEYIFTTSHTLFEEKSRINPHCVMMENGVSEMFLPEHRNALGEYTKDSTAREREIIARIKDLPRPCIGYVGALNVRLWMPVLMELLKMPQNYHTCFVGNIDSSFPQKVLYDLKKCPRMHFFPYISHALIPELMEQFNALLLPFKLTPFSNFINPLKLSEYLTSGKPIIATPLPEVVRIASQPEGMVYFVNDPGEFPVILEKALSQDSPELRAGRIALSRTRTWECATREMIHVVEQLLE
jgi:glycosyltransferase involved in cell wall biosynthesis